MFQTLFFNSTLLATVMSGLMAGVFFIFSNTVMGSLGELQAAQGIKAMQVINRLILNPLFFLFFIGTAVISMGLILTLLWRGLPPGSAYVLSGCLLYLIGVFTVTITFNVPMNDALDIIDPQNIESIKFWKSYLSQWTLWNHVRTGASLLSSVAFGFALKLV